MKQDFWQRLCAGSPLHGIPMEQERRTIAVLGATGYIGGRLVLQLLAAGYRVRALGRRLEKLRRHNRANHPAAELAAAVVLRPASLQRSP